MGTFGDSDLTRMQEPFCLHTSQLCHMDADASPDLAEAAEVLGSVMGLTPDSLSAGARQQVSICWFVMRLCVNFGLISFSLVSSAFFTIVSSDGRVSRIAVSAAAFFRTEHL